jgi:hypothetical protein
MQDQRIDGLTPVFCPVCELGTEGVCDERCEHRVANGRPGHFPERSVRRCWSCGSVPAVRCCEFGADR